MGCMKNFTILLSVVVIGLSVYLYSPIPDGVEEPWKVRSFLAAGKLIKLLCFGSDLIGYSSCLNITRSSINFMLPSPPLSSLDPKLEVTDTTFDGIKVRIYRPTRAETPSPALMYFHGGGWSMGSIDAADTFAMELAKLANIVVVSVEYRLAPEYPFPIPFEDCVTATLHLLHHYKDYGVDGNMVAVGGDGTGGNLAAGIAKRFSEEPPSYLQPLKFQVMLYPALQAFDFNLPSYLKYQDSQILSKSQMIIDWIQYIGLKDAMKYYDDFAGNNHTAMVMKYSGYAEGVSQTLLPESYRSEDTEIVNKNEGNNELSNRIEVTILDPHLSPLMALNLSAVPPAFVVTAEYDVLRDEGMIFAERLRMNGVRVNTYQVKNSMHGFCSVYLPLRFAQLEACNKALLQVAHFIRENVR